ncbi:hypothetical protein AVEN_205692-1, partial [Araneus ventricosus]
ITYFFKTLLSVHASLGVRRDVYGPPSRKERCLTMCFPSWDRRPREAEDNFSAEGKFGSPSRRFCFEGCVNLRRKLTGSTDFLVNQKVEIEYAKIAMGKTYRFCLCFG